MESALLDSWAIKNKDSLKNENQKEINMGRPKKITQIVNAEEYNKEGIVEENPATMIPQKEVDHALDQNQNKQKKGRKTNKKSTVNDMVAEFEIKKQKLVDRYIKKIHKLMGI